MKDMVIVFSEGVIGSQGIATSDSGDYLVGSVTYRLIVDGTLSGPYTSTVKASAGSSVHDPIEIEMPVGYEGALDYAEFAACVDDYFRSLDLVGFGPGASMSNITISNSREEKEKHYVRHYHPAAEPCTLRNLS